jgi:predicted dehydrogenase
VIIGILGGGFGLYGYLPAAILNGYKVVTLSRYKEKIQSRPELSIYLPSVEFATDEESLMNSSDSLVIARDPSSQFDILIKAMGKFEHIYLEKPLGSNQNSHQYLLELLLTKNQAFSVAYLVEFTDWFQQLRTLDFSNINISWEMELNTNSWKSNLFSDKGIFSYYGIHLIPIISNFYMPGNNLVATSSNDRIEISTTRESASLHISLLNGLHPKFRLAAHRKSESGEFIVRLDTPFGKQNKMGFPDERIPLLQKYLSSKSLESSQVLTRRYEELFLALQSQIS